MRVVRTISALRRWVRSEKRKRHSIGFVPTMGDLHAGHLALIRRARRENARVVVSIFVNPTQFNEVRDYRRYHRNLEADRRQASACGADLVFAPSAREMYPFGVGSRVRAPRQAEGLCGAFRPGHFDGVATVVAKLFNCVEPDRAYFGRKDAQQAAVVRQLVKDLNFPVEVQVCPTVRDRDGLALSSRNRRLRPREREQAVRIWRALAAVRDEVRGGKGDRASLRAFLRSRLKGPGMRLEYAEVVDPATCVPVNRHWSRALVAVCVWVGDTRLIDNVIVRRPSSVVLRKDRDGRRTQDAGRRTRKEVVICYGRC
ncbi:MAG: pantoate--beta-alanine ligase [Candidatus Omnitrophica bacterium]|nr:pantoate--beta-alanine ligase [Candidatus Omnitrophota bacterium]